MSNNLTITQVAEASNNKETAINDQAGELDAAFTEDLDMDFTSGNVTVLTLEMQRNMRFVATNLSVARTVTFPAVARYFIVDNSGGTATLGVIIGSTTITLAIGEVGTFKADGSTNHLVLTANSSAAPFDIGSFFVGVPGSSEPLLRFVFTRAVTFPSGLTGSEGLLLVAATAQTDVDIQKNGSSVGTMRWAASGTVATFIAASPITMAAGDELRLIAPSSADATAADLLFTLAGTRGT